MIKWSANCFCAFSCLLDNKNIVFSGKKEVHWLIRGAKNDEVIFWPFNLKYWPKFWRHKPFLFKTLNCLGQWPYQPPMLLIMSNHLGVFYVIDTHNYTHLHAVHTHFIPVVKRFSLSLKLFHDFQQWVPLAINFTTHNQLSILFSLCTSI